MKRFVFGMLVASVLDVALGATGRTAASFGSSQTGAAQYSIPLFAPPGTAGMTPAISLSYSSEVTEGLAGAGFNIAGLSVIARCNRTVEQDGAASAPKLASADRLCLDGVQLKYDTTTGTYRTELESFTRITPVGTAGSGPAYFIAEQKNGLIYEYGNSADSRIESLAAGGGQAATARAWALSKIRDRAGNAIDLTYTEDTTYGAFRPSEIRWTSNASVGLSAANRIVFVYESAARPDVLYGYRFGNTSSIDGQITETRRLDRIDVYGATALVRRYELAYEATGGAGGRSRLQSIQECGVGGAECYAPTQFSWINGTLGWSTETSTGQAVPTQPLVMDINNDGRDDLVYSSSAIWYYMLASTSGGYSAPVSTGQASPNASQALPLDWDGDGCEDFIAPNSANQWVIFRAACASGAFTGFSSINTGIAFAASVTEQWWTADMDGDGRGDLIHALTNTPGVDIRVRYGTASGFGAEALAMTFAFGAGNTIMRPNAFGTALEQRSATRRPDFNGDGREDFVILLLNTGEPDPPNPTTADEYLCMSTYACTLVGVGTVPGQPPVPQTWLLGDANGDGLTDLFYIQKNVANVVVSRGTGSSTVASLALSGYNFALARTADWDGDGKDDLVVPNASGVLYVWRSTGVGLSSPVATSLTSGDFASVGDMNGDGLPDLMSYRGTWGYASHQGAPADMLDRASDGYGNVVDFDYVSIAQGNHTPDSSASYPERTDQRARYVVSQYSASNGIGGSYTTSYWYYGARTHVRGRGFEGFRGRRMLDSRNGFYVYEYYKQLFPLTGELEERSLRQSSGTLITRTTNTWPAAYSYGSGTETRRLPFVSRSLTERWEAGGSYNGALISSTTTDSLIDAATGTVYDTTAVTSEVGTGQSTTQRTYHLSLYTNTAVWCIGRPAVTEQRNSHTGFGGALQVRTLATTWDGTNCRPTESVSQPGDSQWRVTTGIGYDIFGNVSSQTVTGIGMPARTTTMSWGFTGQFPTTLTNALSQQTNLSWDVTLGVPILQSDANGISIAWQYDGFGRKTGESRADGTASTWSYNDCSTLGCVNANNRMVVVATELDTKGAAIRNGYAYLDKFDRPLITRSQTMSGAYDRIEREYDAQGNLYRESSPCWWGACTSATSYWTRYAYDDLNRLTQISRPLRDGGVYSCGTMDSSTQCQHTYLYYEGLAVRTVDAEGKQSTKVASLLGALARSTDAGGYSQTFDYDPFGNLVRVADGETLQSYTYAINGARLTSTDVDMGAWIYKPNALGETLAQTDANGATTTFSYDLLGRLTSRVFPNAGGSLTSTFSWGNSVAAANIGRLEWQEISGAGVTRYRETYSYDSLSRLSQTEYTQGAAARYYVNQTYAPTTGLLETLTYPVSTAGYRLKLRYDYQHGDLYQIVQPDTSQRLWLVSAKDARGNVVDETIGNPGDAPSLMKSISGYDQVTGLLDYRQSGLGGSAAAQNLAYEWSRVGNLTMRQDLNRSLIERFGYDALHRLDYSTLNGTTNLDLDYDSRGNIKRKSGVGSYTYSPTRLHAVTSINTGRGTLSYTYDANGNMLSRAGQVLTWYANNLPKSIAADSGNSSSFEYTPYGQRWLQTYVQNGTTQSTVYIGKIFEKVVSGGVATYKHYVHVGDRAVLFYLRDDNGAKKRYSVLQDHLGSTDAFYNSDGTLKLRESFDAFGARRGTAWTGNPTTSDTSNIAALTRRGFTQHEALDSTGFIHMNGRLYDPALGRFASADPFIPDPNSTQAFNRYSYVDNNPLSFTDPSGYTPFKLLKTDNWADYADFNAQMSSRDPECPGCNAWPQPNHYWHYLPQDSLAWLASQIDKSNQSHQTVGSPSRQSPDANRLPPGPTPPADVPLQQQLDSCAAPSSTASTIALPLPGVRTPEISGALGWRLLGMLGLAFSLVGDTPQRQPQYVVRGGLADPANLISGSGPVDPPYTHLTGFSVTTAPGMTVAELALARRYPNKMLSYTTLDDLREIGVSVVPTPFPNNPLHSTAVVPIPLDPARAAQISGILKRIPNPACGGR